MKLSCSRKQLISENNADAFIKKLSGFDVVVFDLFDTLIFRPMEHPEDLFWLLGEQLEVMNFKHLRILAEREARQACRKENGHEEVSLGKIWETLSRMTHVEAEDMKYEMAIEENLCFANPVMLTVWNQLKEKGIRLVVLADTCLPSAFLERLLQEKGFGNYEKLYVTNEYKKSEANGDLFQVVKSELTEKYGTEIRFAYIGNHSNNNDFQLFLYYGTDENDVLDCTFHQSYIIGSAYRASVYHQLFTGQSAFSPEYRFGYIYGGLFVLGFCSFIHEYCVQEGCDKVLFLSPAGEIVYQVYSMLFPHEESDCISHSEREAFKLEQISKCVVADFGWTGSAAIELRYLVKNVWRIPCEITGILAGTEIPAKGVPESMMQSGKLVPYLHPDSFSRDMENKQKLCSISFQNLFSSGNEEMQQGILDFAKNYMDHFQDFPYMLHISGEDAYAPLLNCKSRNKKQFRSIERRLGL
ncbi:MAG: hypothetical protein IKF90_02775 [Parasporobacterium sp.]|nr:hypothetical protein [Parasporobacterium sp.]